MSAAEHVFRNGGDAGLYPPVLKLPNTALESRVPILRNLFIATFKEEPLFYIRVPGRVNLIGEHIDYCGYLVCPMAIRQSVVVAVRPTDKRILHVTNLEKKYPDFQCSMDAVEIGKRSGPPEWHNYFLCGVKGILEMLPRGQRPVGMQAAVMGNIPPNSGLSSSSALVCAASLTTAYVNKLNLTKVEIATVAAKSEQYIGTEGGGMDQAIAFLGTEGCAKQIEFNPLQYRDVVLPSNAVFVVAHSLAEVNKAGDSEFNLRVAECRLACQILAKHCKLPWETLTRLADLQKSLGLDLDKMVSLVMSVLHEAPYTKEEICATLNVTEDKLNHLSLHGHAASFSQFKLKQRALHVFQEARRVTKFCDECDNGGAGNESTLRVLGDLMRKSHTSLRQLYECSHESLDSVVKIADRETFGARLTGAGWGGCVVALSTTSAAVNFVQVLKEEYYKDHPAAQGRDVNELVFTTEPCDGAQIYTTC